MKIVISKWKVKSFIFDLEMKLFYGICVLFLFSRLGCSHLQSAVPLISVSTTNLFFGLGFFYFFLSYSRSENYVEMPRRDVQVMVEDSCMWSKQLYCSK